MNTLMCHPDRACPASPVAPPARLFDHVAEQVGDTAADDESPAQTTPASHADVEPEGDGILFAAFCLVSSLLIYSAVITIRLLA